MNILKIDGHLSSNPELRYSGRGKASGCFRILRRVLAPKATNLGAGGKNNALLEEFEVVLFGAVAEQAAHYATKGRRVIIEGELAQERWDLGGRHGARIKILARRLEFPERKKEEGELIEDAFIELTDAVRPALRVFKKRLSKMRASEAVRFLSDAVNPFVRAYNRRRASFAGPQSVLWPTSNSAGGDGNPEV